MLKDSLLPTFRSLLKRSDLFFLVTCAAQGQFNTRESYLANFGISRTDLDELLVEVRKRNLLEMDVESPWKPTTLGWVFYYELYPDRAPEGAVEALNDKFHMGGYEDWLYRVEAHLTCGLCITSDDFADEMYQGWYRSGMTPEVAAKTIDEENSENGK